MDIEVGEDVRPEPKKNKSDKGFTLIELLIVIVILGVLSTVVVLSVGGITDKGKKASCKSDYNALATAVESYNAQNGTYPTTQAPVGERPIPADAVAEVHDRRHGGRHRPGCGGDRCLHLRP